jgi:two-component system response regulator VicR
MMCAHAASKDAAVVSQTARSREGTIIVDGDGARATAEQMQRQHIFVVNGSVEFLDVVREVLQEEHYNVTTTNFVPRTFQQIATANPSLLIIDLAIGEQAGWELLAELRQAAATNQIPIVLVSTSRELLNTAEAERVKWGGDRSLLKPFSIDELLRIVTELVGPA